MRSQLELQMNDCLRELVGGLAAKQLCEAQHRPRLAGRLTGRLQRRLNRFGVEVRQIVLGGVHPPDVYLKGLIAAQTRQVEVEADVYAMHEIQNAVHPWDLSDRQIVTDLEGLRGIRQASNTVVSPWFWMRSTLGTTQTSSDPPDIHPNRES